MSETARSDQMQRTIANLREKLLAAREVFDAATSFHEAWKPTAYDPTLHSKIGRSYAANTFRTIRFALRREMLLALMRLWDTQDDSIKMTSFVGSLRDAHVVDALALECEAKRLRQTIHHCDDSEVSDPAVDRFILERFAGEDSARLRQRARDALILLEKYSPGGIAHHVVEKLRVLRNKRFAHHQIRFSVAEVSEATPTDEEIEGFYQDMSKLIHRLCLAVEDVHYDPEETAAIRRRHASLFWAGVQGERTEGHPNFAHPPILRNSQAC
jgi:hypothetical protein